jgi:hypothetical protein
MTDINWTPSGKATTNTFLGTVGATIDNMTPATHRVFSAVWDCNIIMMSIDQTIPYQCYANQTTLNT